jgi:hypothetical protein
MANASHARPSDDRRTRFGWTLLLAWLLSASAAAPAVLAADAEKPAAKKDALDNEPAQWMRFSEDKKGNAKLEVGVGTYKNDAGVTVQLVGAVHVGDKKYYSDLDKQFEGYDALLYEMVKPANAGAPQKGQRGASWVSMFQRTLKDTLELEFQLDGIDYSKKNFVHADLDAETFEKLQAERGESIIGLMFQQMLKDFAKQMEGKGGNDNAKPQAGLLDILAALDSPDRAKTLKMLLGRSFGDMEAQASAFQGTVLVTERNKKAIEVLRTTIRDGKKNVGVFYGAAHMPDLEARLALMGFKRTAFEYKTAWDISDKQPAK